MEKKRECWNQSEETLDRWKFTLRFLMVERFGDGFWNHTQLRVHLFTLANLLVRF